MQRFDTCDRADEAFNYVGILRNLFADEDCNIKIAINHQIPHWTDFCCNLSNSANKKDEIETLIHVTHNYLRLQDTKQLNEKQQQSVVVC